MDSVTDTSCEVGCPIRRSSDQSLLAAPQGLSQRATSFIASRRQGIHQMPFSHSPRPSGKSRRPEPSAHPIGAEQAYPCRAPPPAPPHERREEGGGKTAPLPVSRPPGDKPQRPVAHHHHTMSCVKERLPPTQQPRAHPHKADVPSSILHRCPSSSPRKGERRPGLVGPGRLERPTSRLSGVRSNQLSYGPAVFRDQRAKSQGSDLNLIPDLQALSSLNGRDVRTARRYFGFPHPERPEAIRPQRCALRGRGPREAPHP